MIAYFLSRAKLKDCRDFKRVISSYCLQFVQAINLAKFMVMFSPKASSIHVAEYVSYSDIRKVDSLGSYLGVSMKNTCLKMQ